MLEAGDTPTHHTVVALPLASSHSLASPPRRNASFLFDRRQIGAHALEYFCGHPDRFTQGGMGMDGLADADGVATHLDRQAYFADQVSCMSPHDAAAEHAMVGLIEQKLGETLVAAIGDCSPGSGPRKNGFTVLDAMRLALVFGEACPRDLRIRIGNRWDLPRLEQGVLAGRCFRRNMRFVHSLVGEHRLDPKRTLEIVWGSNLNRRPSLGGQNRLQCSSVSTR